MTFREAFCRCFQCREEAFEKAVLRRCFPPLSRALGTIALAINPSAFQRELALIRRLGAAGSNGNVRGELDGYAYENQRDKRARTETFGLRLSRRRFLKLWREAFDHQPDAGMEPKPEEKREAGAVRRSDSPAGTARV